MINKKTLTNMLNGINREDGEQYNLTVNSPGDGMSRYEVGVKVHDGHFHVIAEGMNNKEAYHLLRAIMITTSLRRAKIL